MSNYLSQKKYYKDDFLIQPRWRSRQRVSLIILRSWVRSSLGAVNFFSSFRFDRIYQWVVYHWQNISIIVIIQNNHIFTRSGVRTHAGIRPLELKSNALTTRPSWLYFVNKRIKVDTNSYILSSVIKISIRSQQDLNLRGQSPLDFESNALTSRP